jgi:hypothetical protein
VGSHPDLPLCREASNCSSLHPSGRFSSPSGRPSVFDQASGFLSKHRYGKITAAVWKTWIPVRMRSSIRQVSQFKSRRQSAWSGRACIRYGNCVHQIDRQDAHPLGPDAQSLYMKITCSGRTTVRTTVPHRPDAALKQERSSTKFLKFRSHKCPDGRPMTTARTTPSFIMPDAHLNC